MKNFLAGCLVGAIGTAAVLLAVRCANPDPPPRARFLQEHKGKQGVAEERLRARLVRPDSLEVLEAKLFPLVPDPNGKDRLVSVELRFRAAGPDGAAHEGLFVVRWIDGVAHDVLPEPGDPGAAAFGAAP